MPIFLMISEALLLNREYPSLEKFLKHRFARIIYPFIFWIILILGQLYLHGYYPKFIWNVFIGEPPITWYLWILIGIYLFIPVLNSFIKDYKIKGAEYFLAIWFFTMILKTFNSYPLWHYFNLDIGITLVWICLQDLSDILYLVIILPTRNLSWMIKNSAFQD